jgi:hypothetical protein
MLFWLFYCCSPDRQTLPFRSPRRRPTSCLRPTATDRSIIDRSVTAATATTTTTAATATTTAATATTVSTNCYQPTTIDRLPLPRFLLLKVLPPNILLLTNCYRVLLPSIIPLTVLFYFTALTICFYYCLYHCYYYCCYYCYCYRYCF